MRSAKREQASRHPKEHGSGGPSTVIVGVSGSPQSLRALDYASGVCRRSGGLLICGHVAVQSHAAEAAMLLGAPTLGGFEAIHARELTRNQIAAEIIASGRDALARTTLVVCSGDPVVAICRLAAEHYADLVVIGASRGSRLRRRSVAQRLVGRSRWPLIVIP